MYQRRGILSVVVTFLTCGVGAPILAVFWASTSSACAVMAYDESSTYRGWAENLDELGFV
jgi:hypothetical protein